jgi:acyl-CoA synthetase (NDP forming)
MAATFTAAVEDSLPQPGGIAYVGQSGAVGGSILSLAGERGIGIADWASTGNQADLTALEIGEYLIGDDRVRVLTMYLESPVDGGQFERVARRARDLDKSVVVLQSGLSHSGARAAASHTGAIVGSNADFLAMAREFGVIVAEDIADFVTAMQSLTALPRARGRRVGIVTTSGGAGSLAADQLEAAGLLVEPLAETTQDRLRATVPAFGAVANPVDVTAQLFRSGLSDDFVNVCRTVVDDEEVDSLLVVLTMVTGEMAVTMAKDLRELWRTNSKPMVVVWLAAHAQTVEARALLSEEGWPVTDSPRLAARTLAVLSTDSVEERPRRAAVRTLAGVEERLAAVGGDIVTEAAATSLLELANVRQPRQAVATSARHAREVAVELGGTVVMKIQSAEVLHKTDRGGVRLSVPVDRAGEVFDELTAAFGEIPDAAVLVQEQIVGMTRSGINFPPLLTVGVGGVATELYKDTTSFLAPVDAATARRMILALRAAPLMQGFRGMETLDLELVSEQIAAISQLGVALGDRLQELEINPLRVRAAGTDVVALDFLLRLSDAHATGEGGRSG